MPSSPPSFGLNSSAAALAASPSQGCDKASAARVKQTHDELIIAEREQEELTGRIAKLKARLEDEQQSLEEEQDAVTAHVKPRRLLTAYFLWLFTPFVWPGAYLFYCGRDAHALLHTVTFGGFGIGWLVDAIYIPQYVADHNAQPGYREAASRSLRRWWAPGALLLSPLTLTLQWLDGLYFGVVGAYLVPRPVGGPADLREGLWNRYNATTAALAAGMLAAAVAVRLASTRVGRSRCGCRWGRLLGWAATGTALLRPTLDDAGAKLDDAGLAPQLVLGCVVLMVGAASGRQEAMTLAPRRRTARRLSVRLVVQVVGVAAFTAAALGAFYLNGSFTHTDSESGLKVTMTGPEALGAAWRNALSASEDISEGVSRLRAQYAHKSWADIWQEVREAFRDPSHEAAALLGVGVDAPLAKIKSAYRKLAQQHHPDKVRPEEAEAAKLKMQRINWAKEVMMRTASGSAADAD